MIAWIDDRLVRWGEFVNGAVVHARYGSGSPYPAYRLVKIRGAGVGASVCMDDDVIEIDVLMAGVRKESPELFDVAYWLYVAGTSPFYAAERARCHVNTVYNRRYRLHEHLKSKLTMRVAA